MFSCFQRVQFEEPSKKPETLPELKETDLYSTIEESIYDVIGENDFEIIINEIFFMTKSKTIGIRPLKKILETYTKNPDAIMKIFSENFVFIAEPAKHVEQLKQLYNDFNIELIILNQLQLLPNEKNKLELFIDHIKDITFPMPEIPADMRFNSMSIVFFFLMFSGKHSYEKKVYILFNILNLKSSSYIIGSPAITQITAEYVMISLFFLDIEFNSRMKSEAINMTSKDFFSMTKLENIIFYKKILMIYHNFPKSNFDDLVLYFLHNMFISAKKSDPKIKFGEFLENFKSRSFDIFKPSEIRNFMMNFFSFNKTFFTLLINAIKQFILHYESVYDDTGVMKQSKPKITNQEYIVEFNMIKNLETLDNILKKPDYYFNIFKKDFFKKKKEDDEVAEMLVTSVSYSKASQKIKKSVLSSQGFKSKNDKKTEDSTVYFKNETKDLGKKPISLSSKSLNSFSQKNKGLMFNPRLKKLDLEVIHENEESNLQIESERKRKTKIKRKNMLEEKVVEELNSENKIDEEIEFISEDGKKMENDSVKEVDDIDAMLINNDEQYRLSEIRQSKRNEDAKKQGSNRSKISGINNNMSVIKKDDEMNGKLEKSKELKENEEMIMNSLEKSKYIKGNKDSKIEENKPSEEKNEIKNQEKITPIGITPNEVPKEDKQNINDKIDSIPNNPDFIRESRLSKVDRAIRESTQRKEIFEIDITENKFNEGNKELSDIEKDDNIDKDSDIEKDEILIDFRERTEIKVPKDPDASIFTDSEFQAKQETFPVRPSDTRDIKYDSRANQVPNKNPFISKKSIDNENNNINNRYNNITEDLLNEKNSREPIDIILGQREGKANAYQNVENSTYKNQNDKMDLNLESLNIVLKQNKNQQSFVSNHKSYNDKLKNNQMIFNTNNVYINHSSSERVSSKENKEIYLKTDIKSHPNFGAFLQSYLDNFSHPDTSAISTYKSGISMLGVKSLQDKLKEKVPKNYYSKLLKFVKSFNPNSIKDILELNMKVELINMYFVLLQIYNEYLAETQNVERIKIFDISLFLNLQDCFTNGNFEPLLGYFKEDDIFTTYKKIIIPIYVENNMDVSENLILSLFDIKEHMIYFYDAKGILICDMNIIENYRIMFENCFKYWSEKKLIQKENINWKTVNDEAIPDFLQDYAFAIILFVAEKFSRNETVTFDNDNIDAEHWNERIFVQIADFYNRLNRNY